MNQNRIPTLAAIPVFFSPAMVADAGSFSPSAGKPDRKSVV